MLTIEQAIAQYEQFANVCEHHGLTASQEEFEQLAAWLRELQERRKAPEIIRCKDCNWNDGTCYCNFHYRNVKPHNYCSWVERRTE